MGISGGIEMLVNSAHILNAENHGTKTHIQNLVMHLRCYSLRKKLTVVTRELFPQKTPSSMFAKALNTPLEQKNSY